MSQIKTIVPDFYKFNLVKSPKHNFRIDLIIAPVYGSYIFMILNLIKCITHFILLGLENKYNIDLIKLTTWRKNTFFSALINIMKEHHKVS